MSPSSRTRERPRALIFGSFARTAVASGLDTALENLLASPLGERYELVVVSLFRGERTARGMIERIAYGSWLFAKTVWQLAVSRCAVADVHAVSGRDFLKNGAVVLAARATRTPIVLRIHGGNFDRVYREAGRFEQGIARKILRVADRVILLSKSWDEVARSIEPGARTGVIPNSVDCDALADAQKLRRPAAEDVLMLGNFCERKGHFDAVDAAAIVKKSHPRVHFRFFGVERDPGALSALQSKIRAAALDDTVAFLPPVFGAQKLERIAQAGIFILPSHTENMPMAVMEAMAAGMAVVATKVGAIPEMIDHGETGILVEPHQPERLAQAIVRLLDDPNERLRLGRRAAEAARRTWDKKVVGERTAALFDSVAWKR
jgi:glycosyltransferase involved in cell wall biosynthesis